MTTRERKNATARAYHHRHKDRLNAIRRARHLESRYGLTLEEFDELLVRQGGGCAICQTTEPARGWHVDHDHACCPQSSRSCGRCIRGILCSSCNQGLGTRSRTRLSCSLERSHTWGRRDEDRYRHR